MIVERFLQWLRTAPMARRADAAGALARAYLYSTLADEERDGVEAAMTILLDDPAVEVRLGLADALAGSDKAPHHIILSLAADRTQIAQIVVERSPLILDSELVDIVATRDEAVQIAAARRPVVSRAVAAAVAEVGGVEACLELLCNPGARVPRFSLDRIVERHGGHAELRNTLLERADLPVEIRQALVAGLARALSGLVVSRNWLPADRADMMMREARERATIAMAFEAPAEEMAGLVRRMIAAEELTPALLVRAVVSGQILFFETALAALADLPANRVAALLASGRGANLQALLQKAGLPERTYPAFAAAIDVIRTIEAGPGVANDYRRATTLIDAIVNRYDGRADRELDQILALLRRFATEAKRNAARGYLAQMTRAA